jgi:hypothetical protein
VPVITAEDRKMRLSWRGILCVMFGTLLLALPFVYFRRFDLARPSIMAALMVTIAIALRWKLRRYLWFWATMTFLVGLHLPLILFIPWTTRWIPAVVIAPVGVADLYAMLWLLSVVGRIMEEPKPSNEEHSSSSDTTTASR